MFENKRRWVWLLGGLVGCALMIGCSEPEKREMRVHEETHEGEVEDVGPGEMIVE